ncbi:hypothetical protein ACROYT_G026431 [Oculina patagonica]
MGGTIPLNGVLLRIVLVIAISVSAEGAWKNLIGTWSDSGSSWIGSIPYNDAQWHFGPARLWTTPLNTDNYGRWMKIPGINNNSDDDRGDVDNDDNKKKQHIKTFVLRPA